jgi:hypothetical protein
MVIFRQRVVDDIIGNMSKHGFNFPPELDLTLKKIWFTMDLPRNGNRIGVLHQSGYWLDRDVFLASMFFMKLDLRLSDPVEGSGQNAIRTLMLGCRNLLPMRDILCARVRSIHIMRLFTWYDYRPSPQNLGMPIFGVPPELVGRGFTEGWGRGNTRLLRVDEGVMSEGIRRSLNLQRFYFDFVMSGVRQARETWKREKEERKRRALMRLKTPKGERPKAD